MGLYILLCFFLHLFFSLGLSDNLDFPIGGRVTIPIPSAYQDDFQGRAFFLDSGKELPNFRAALSVEAVGGKYSCSLAVFLGAVKVWASDHFFKFLPNESCVIELTHEGDLQLQDRTVRVGWRTGTAGQGVMSLRLEKKTGNLILSDAKNHTRWQSFDFPTYVMLWSQQLNASTRLTSFPANSSAFYSFEVQSNKLSLYLNYGDQKYSYWEMKPLSNTSISFIRLGSKGLKLFSRNSRKIGQIQATSPEPVRFLALGKAGNLGLYYYSIYQGEFESSYQALNKLCDLPLPCGPYGICTSSGNCTCLELPRKQGNYSGFCGGSYNSEVEMVELDGVDTVLTTARPKTNLSTEECVSLCMENCSCAAALHSRGECSHYALVGGAREVERETELSYWVKVPKERGGHHGMSSSLRKKLLLLGEVADVLALCLILGGMWYCLSKIHKRRRDNLGTDNN